MGQGLQTQQLALTLSRREAQEPIPRPLSARIPGAGPTTLRAGAGCHCFVVSCVTLLMLVTLVSSRLPWCLAGSLSLL